MENGGKSKKIIVITILALIVGIWARFAVAQFGFNVDFVNFINTGEIASHLHNVYPQTPFYNYGPIYFCILGIFRFISRFFGDFELSMYRYLIIGLLTCADMGIAIYLKKHYSLKAALFFFLNPASIFITGYHNQFDNIAVFLALIAIGFYNTEEKFTKKDVMFILCFATCLITKHIFYAFPLWIFFRNDLPLKKRFIYAGAPVVLFFLSFVPFCRGAGLTHIINNVFLYRSTSNAPLFIGIYKLLNVPQNLYFYIFILMMCLSAWLFRKHDIRDNVLLYTVALVAFSSSIANQYLVIPLAGVIALSNTTKYLYTATATYHYIVHRDGLGLLTLMPGEKIGFNIACVLLFLIVLKQLNCFGKKINELI